MKFIPKYEDFIELLSKQNYSPDTQMENHHIVPKFEFAALGNEEYNAQNSALSVKYVEFNKNNIIRISARHHTLAHYVRYKNFHKKGDKISYLIRRNMTNEAIILKEQLIAETLKLNKKLFWSSEWQSIQGKKGGAKGGSANTDKQFQARQKVGQTYGKTTGIGNQSDSSRFFLTKLSLWEHPSSGFIVEVPCQESFANVINYINACADEQNLYGTSEKSKQIDTIRNASSFAKVRDGHRSQMYGWKLLSKGTEIRSEAHLG